MNGELTGLEKIPKKVFIEIDKEKTTFKRTEEGFECVIYGKNISNMPMVDWEYDVAGKITDKYDYEIETVKKAGVAYVAFYNVNTVELHILDPFFEKETFILCVKLILSGIYNYKTVQTFNIVVKDSVMCEVLSREECITN